MFLNFLDVLIEKKLKSKIFIFWKGKELQTIVGNAYQKLHWIKWIRWNLICNIRVEKSRLKVFHEHILRNYLFPKSHIFLLFRWLTPNIFYYNNLKIKKLKWGFIKTSILWPSILNMLFLHNLQLKTKTTNAKKVWFNIFCTINSNLLLVNESKFFYNYIIKIKKQLKKIGLLTAFNDTTIFRFLKSKIEFKFLNFDIIFVTNVLTKKSFKHCIAEQPFSHGKQKTKTLITIWPSIKTIKQVKRKLKQIIKKVFYRSNKNFNKAFQQINFALRKWGRYYYFDKACTYSGRRLRVSFSVKTTF